MTLRDIKDFLVDTATYIAKVGSGEIYWLDANIFALLIVACWYGFLLAIVLVILVKLLTPSTYVALGQYLIKGPKNLFIFFTFDPEKHETETEDSRWDYLLLFLVWLMVTGWSLLMLIGISAVVIHGK